MNDEVLAAISRIERRQRFGLVEVNRATDAQLVFKTAPGLASRDERTGMQKTEELPG